MNNKDLSRGKGDPDVHGYQSGLTLPELINKLGETKQVANEFYKNYKHFKEEEDGLKAELLSKLKDSGFKSIKGEAYLASISETPTVVIRDETKVMEWLKTTQGKEADFYIGVKKLEFSALAKSMLKETGELADGTEVETRESLSIRANKAKG